MRNHSLSVSGSFRIFKFSLFILIFLFPVLATAQELLDSVDSLLSAQFAAATRTQSGFLNDALSAEKAALETAQHRYGPTHLSLVPVLTDLATLYRIMGRYEEAESQLKWGLALREKALGTHDASLADSLDPLASLYSEEGRWEEAEFFEKKALVLREASGNPDSLAASLSLLGDIELNLNKNFEARNFLTRGLAVQEKTAGNPAETLSLLNRLSKAFQAGNNPADAEANLLKALALAKKSFAANSIEEADALEKLADFYFAAGQKEKAAALYQSALKIDKGFVGVYYGYSVLPYMQRLAVAYQAAGDAASAKDLLEKALVTCRDSYGPRHPLLAVTLLRLARAEETLGDSKAARSHREQVLEILKSHFAKNYPLILEVEGQLAK